MPKVKIALLSGGVSGERDVSLLAGDKIFSALNKNKYEIYRYDIRDNLEKFFIDGLNKKFDLVFPALHGPFGEDGRLQGMLDLIGLTYLFSGTLASALAMDKEKSKLIADRIKIHTANDIILNDKKSIDLNYINKLLPFPIFIKPIDSGSSIGMSKVENNKELLKGAKEAFKHSNKIILEEFIKGREFSVTIMGCPAKALPIIEIIPKTSSWFDYEAKYKAGCSDEICPAEINEDLEKEMREAALKIFHAVGCKDLARVDFIWSEAQNKLYFLEINTIPGMTETSLSPKSAKAAGMEFDEFLDNLITTAINSNDI